MVSSVTGSALLSYYQSQAALTLLSSGNSSGASTSILGGTTSTSSGASASTSAAALSAYYLNKEGISSSSSNSAVANAPAAPWTKSGGTPSVSTAVQNAVDGAAFINPSAATLSAPAGANAQDYKNLFALYQGINTLTDLAQTAAASASSSSVSSVTNAQLQAAFTSGMNQVQSFLASSPFTGFNLTAGKVTTSEESTVGIPNGDSTTYTTGIIATGDRGAVMPALSGNVQFNISIKDKYATTPTNVAINLNNMGAEPRTLDNVVNYINAQLKTAGVSTTFSVAGLGNATTTSTVNGQTTTTTGAAQWGLTINGSANEAVSFSAPSTAAAVYVGEQTGGASTLSSTGAQTTTATAQTLFGLETNNSAVGAPPSTTSVSSNNTNLPSGGIFSTNLPSGVNSIEASATGSDGSIYMVADVSGSVSGSQVPGTQGVALLKYDSSGKLLYSKVLPDGADSSGYSLAVNTDGTVAVTGSNTTPASTSANGLTTAATTSAFVQVFDPTGAPSWSATMPPSSGISAASGVTFGANDTVYVSGTTSGSINGQLQHGTSDEYIQGFSATGAATFTTQFGATGGDNTSSGIAYDAATNSLYTVGLENSQAVVRSFALNGTAAPTATATRTLGQAASVVGIAVSGGQLMVGGNVNAPTIHAGAVAQAYAGKADGFVASISTNLTPASSDTVSYLGTAGASQAISAMSVAAGQTYVTGSIANDPYSLASNGATEGYVSSVDNSTGAISYSTKFSGTGGQATPTSIAVNASGTSVLNQLGLPSGAINAAGSTLITANTPITAGSSFYVRTSAGGPQTTITVSATDTLASLATKLNTARGGAGTATVESIGANSQLSITPSTGGYIELDSQPANNTGQISSSSSSSSNVLSSLGLSSGVIRTVNTINGLTDVSQLREYGLNLPTNLSLATAASAQHAANAMQAAMASIQQAYQDLADPPTMASEAAAKAKTSGGNVPTYLTNEIANYQAGLNRLLSGG